MKIIGTRIFNGLYYIILAEWLEILILTINNSVSNPLRVILKVIYKIDFLEIFIIEFNRI